MPEIKKPLGLMVLEQDEHGRSLLRRALAAVSKGQKATVYHDGYEIVVEEAFPPPELSR